MKAASMPPRHTPIQWPVTNKTWSCLPLDFARPLEGHMTLVIVDAVAKWIEALPMKTATSETTEDALQVIFATFGLPRNIVIDNGPHFTSTLFRDFVNQNQIHHLTMAPYHPQSNGMAQRPVRTIKEGLGKNAQVKLQERLTRLLRTYRQNPVKQGKSPAELLLGYEIRTKTDCITSNKHAMGTEPQDKSPQKWEQGQRVWTRSWTRSK